MTRFAKLLVIACTRVGCRRAPRDRSQIRLRASKVAAAVEGSGSCVGREECGERAPGRVFVRRLLSGAAQGLLAAMQHPPWAS